MKTQMLMIGAVALALSPAAASAGRPTTTSTSQTNGPTTTGQPSQDCEMLVELGMGSTPGQSADARGSAFNPDGVSGTKYAGEQPQNSKNSASVSQYDVACLHGTR
jgi:hypothetical protein